MSTTTHKDQRLTPDSLTEQVLTQAQSSREVVQDFVPLAQSLEWDLGQQYLRQRGNKAFISDSSPVPFVINNDGTLSRHAAEVFVASLLEADKAGTLPKEIHVLELGIGVGLFARYFLDHMQELSRQHKKDYYQRLTYTAADRSERMLTDVLRHGVLAHHPGRYRVRQVDAMQPEILARDVAYSPHPQPLSHGARGENGKPFRAVFLNYLLDCLPAAVLQFDSIAPRGCSPDGSRATRHAILPSATSCKDDGRSHPCGCERGHGRRHRRSEDCAVLARRDGGPKAPTGADLCGRRGAAVGERAALAGERT